jgi:hypothetical protein
VDAGAVINEEEEREVEIGAPIEEIAAEEGVGGGDVCGFGVEVDDFDVRGETRAVAGADVEEGGAAAAIGEGDGFEEPGVVGAREVVGGEAECTAL